MDEKTLEAALMNALDCMPNGELQDDQGNEFDVFGTQSFSAQGMLTNNHGFTMKMSDGTEFQVTLVQSK